MWPLTVGRILLVTGAIVWSNQRGAGGGAPLRRPPPYGGCRRPRRTLLRQRCWQMAEAHL